MNNKEKEIYETEAKKKKTDWRKEVMNIINMSSTKHRWGNPLLTRNQCQEAKTAVLSLIQIKAIETVRLNKALALLESGWVDGL